MTEWTREQAIRRICRERLDALSPEERAQHVETIKGEAWDTHPRWPTLAPDLRRELEDEGDTTDPEASRFDSALLMVLEDGFHGVLNAYLAAHLHDLRIPCSAVTGEVEPRLACPCCGYLTLEERGVYSICRVCFWEDDGSDNPGAHSGPNHMTLAQGRRNFARFGAVTRRERELVDPDGPRKYPRSPTQT